MQFFKQIFKVSVYTFIIITLITVVLYFYFKNSITDLITEKQLSELVTDIKISNSLPDKFYQLYEIEKPENLEYSSKRVLAKNLIKYLFFINREDDRSPSILVAQTYMPIKNINERRRDFKINENIIAWNIEDNVNQKECINWLIENCYSPNNDKSLRVFIEDYYKKEIYQFNERELAGIVVIIKNQSLYNPIRRKEKFDNAVDILLTRFHKNKN